MNNKIIWDNADYDEEGQAGCCDWRSQGITAAEMNWKIYLWKKKMFFEAKTGECLGQMHSEKEQ